MRLGPLVIAEKGVVFGIADKNGNGIGFLSDPVEASGILDRIEPSFSRSRRQK